MKVTSDLRLGFWPEAEGRRQFERDMGANRRREWDSLSAETEPDLLAHAALSLAAKLERSEAADKAVFLLSGLREASSLSPELRQQAEERWATLQGAGKPGTRFETLLANFLGEARNPGPLLAMAVAGFGFHLSRIALLAKLPTATARLASPLATLAEAGAFSAALPLFSHRVQPPGEAAARSHAVDFLSALLLISSLRLSVWPLRFAPRLPRFPSLYAGVLLAQGLQRRWGLLPEAKADAALLDGLALSLSLHAGAGLAKAVLGSSGMRWLAEAEGRGRLPRKPPPRPAIPWGTRVPAEALAGKVAGPRPRLPEGTYAMSENGSNSSRPRLRLVSPDPHEEFVQTFGNNPPFQEAYHRILNFYGPRHEGSKLRNLLIASGVRHPAKMNPGIQELAERLQRSKLGEGALSYGDWLAQKSYEKVYFENRHPEALGEILLSLASRESAGALEQKLAPHFGELDLRGPKAMSTDLRHSHQFQVEAARRLHEWRRFESESSGLPLTEAALSVVFRWKQAQADHYFGNLQAPIHRFFDDLCELGQSPQAPRLLAVNKAIEAAGQSPLGGARLARLAALLRLHRGQVPASLLEELR